MNGIEESAKCFSSLQMFWVLPKTIRMQGLSGAPVSKRGAVRIREGPGHACGHIVRQDSNPSPRSLFLSTTL